MGYNVKINRNWLWQQYCEYNKSSNEIAIIIGCSPNTILNHLRRNNIPIKDIAQSTLRNINSIQFKNREWLTQKYIIEKLNVYQMSNVANVTPATIHKWLKFFNIPTRKNEQAQLKNVDAIQFKNKEWLYSQYIVNQMSISDISKLIKVNKTTISNWLKKFSINIRPLKISRKGKCKGENHHNWKGGVSTLYEIIRSSTHYNEWRKTVFERDKFACRICEKPSKNDINVDHIKPFSIIIKENNIDTLEKAEICKELWDVDNGRTLCIACHKKTDTWGSKVKNYKENKNE